MSVSHLRKRNVCSFSQVTSFLFALALLGLLTACALPKSMGVRSGTEPRHEDDDVRFRVTYFYRVYDYCSHPSRAKDDPYHIKSDSLYRFRMTGKANALFTKVHFESGTLKSYEIDPLGAAVAFDEKNGRFHFQSREQTERNANCAAVEEEMERLAGKIKAFSSDQAANATLINAYNTRLTALAASNACLPVTIVEKLPAPSVDNTKPLRLAGSNLGEVAVVTPDPLPIVATLTDSKNITLTVNLNDAATKLKKAGNAFKGMESGMDNSKGFTEAGDELLTITFDKLSLEGESVKTDAANKFKKSVKDAELKIKDAGSSLKAMVKEPESSSLYLSKAGANLANAGDLLDELADYFSDSEKVLGTNDDKYIPKEEFLPLNKMALALSQVGRNLQVAASGNRANSKSCNPGENLKRGFQVIGPQASSEFDPDDRLVMAMSSSASPLIGQLKDISARVLAEQQSPGDSLLELVKARLTVSKAVNELEKPVAEDETIKSLGDKARKGVQP